MPKPPNRRMTLGVVPSTKANERPSIPASPATRKGTNRPPRGRKSMLPRMDGRENSIPRSPGGVTNSTAASRRRSMGTDKMRRKSLVPPPSSAPAVKTDTRPINDKAFQQQCIKQLLVFLLENGYDLPISPKTLARPSARDFCNIATFMLRLIDPNFQKVTSNSDNDAPPMKFEDEVALNFKYIGYPYNVSKTALVAAGSMHTWPSLLAALSWLMDHIKAQSIIQVDYDARLDDDEPPSSLQELEVRSDRVFFRYLGQSYKAFMRNDAPSLEQLEMGLADRFERDDSYLVQEMERVTELNTAIVERINELSAGVEE